MMHYQWKYFIDLHNKRGSSGFGANPISWADTEAYFRLIEYHPQEWELDLISKLDSIAITAYAKKAEQDQKKSKPKK